VPGETEKHTLERWRRWFQGMGVHPQALSLLERARQEGVADILTLQKWLRKMEQAGRQPAIAGLSMVLNRLTADRTLREWLEWPADCWQGLPGGALLLTCRASQWSRVQLLRAALLAAGSAPGVRLVVHGFPWSLFGPSPLPENGQLLAGNAPLLGAGIVLLTESQAAAAEKLAQRFLDDRPEMRERLQLLGPGEALLVAEGQISEVAWR
jgi:hypothetical protein